MAAHMGQEEIIFDLKICVEGIGGDAIAMGLNIVNDVETVKVGEEDGAAGAEAERRDNFPECILPG
jgi:hypothetical protein